MGNVELHLEELTTLTVSFDNFAIEYPRYPLIHPGSSICATALPSACSPLPEILIAVVSLESPGWMLMLTSHSSAIKHSNKEHIY